MPDHPQLVRGLIGALLLCRPATAADKTPEQELDERIVQLGSPDPKVRAEAACVVGRMGPQGRRAKTALAKALTLEVRRTIPGREAQTCECPKEPEDRSAWVEWSRACRDLRSRAPDPIPWALRRVGGVRLGFGAVMTMIRTEPRLRFDHKDTAQLLAELGPSAIPELAAAIADPDAVVRYIAIRALPSISPHTKRAERLLQKAVDEKTGTTRQEAALALEEFRESWKRERERDRRVRSLGPR